MSESVLGVSNLTTRELDERVDASGLVSDHGVGVVLPDAEADALRAKARSESYSSLAPWFDCPLKWWATRYSDIPQPETPHLPFLVVGTVIHRIAEVFYNEPAAKRTDALLNKLIRLGKTLLEDIPDIDEAAREGLFDAETIAEWRDLRSDIAHDRRKQWMSRRMDAWSAIARGVLDVDVDPRSINVVATEMYITRYVNNVRIACKIDRVIESASGGILIDDWKTGASPRSHEPIEPLTRRYLQPSMYAWALTKHDSSYPVQATRLVFLKDLDVYRLNVDADVIALVHRAMERITEQMNTAVEQGTLMGRPTDAERGHCRECPLFGMCPARGETLNMEEALQEVSRATS